MKNQLFTKLLFVFLFALITHVGTAQTVYVTESGKKYHKKNCSVVSEGKKGIEMAQAKKNGYEACNVCKPEVKAVTTSQKAVATEPKKKK